MRSNIRDGHQYLACSCRNTKCKYSNKNPSRLWRSFRTCVQLLLPSPDLYKIFNSTADFSQFLKTCLLYRLTLDYRQSSLKVPFFAAPQRFSYQVSLRLIQCKDDRIRKLPVLEVFRERTLGRGVVFRVDILAIVLQVTVPAGSRPTVSFGRRQSTDIREATS